MPLWYVVRDGQIWAWTYAKSQKVRNLERDPRATLQIEDGDTYDELRGVMIEARVELHRDYDAVAPVRRRAAGALRRRQRHAGDRGGGRGSGRQAGRASVRGAADDQLGSPQARGGY